MAAQSLRLSRAWDDDFQGWTESLQLGRKRKKPARGAGKASTWTGWPTSLREPADYPGKGSRADVRARLRAIARRGRQVMVKITPGRNRTMRAVRSHLQYIGQDGEGVVHDQDGRAYRGVEEVDDLAWRWQYTGPAIPEASDTRLAFNVMFSMPEGTDERALFAAVKATAETEFAGHPWAMGQHFDRPHVHCHVAVRAEGMDGTRLNPRKADLQRWRERFAHELRIRGVEAEATRRSSRMHQPRMNKPWAVSRLEIRGLPSRPTPAQPNPTRTDRWNALERRAASAYARIIDALDRSNDSVDWILSRELARSLIGQRALVTVRQDHRTPSSLERTRS